MCHVSAWLAPYSSCTAFKLWIIAISSTRDFSQLWFLLKKPSIAQFQFLYSLLRSLKEFSFFLKKIFLELWLALKKRGVPGSNRMRQVLNDKPCHPSKYLVTPNQPQLRSYLGQLHLVICRCFESLAWKTSVWPYVPMHQIIDNGFLIVYW